MPSGPDRVRADTWASVLGLFVGLAGLGLAVDTAFGAHRHTNGQPVAESMIGDGVAHVRGSTTSDIINPPNCRPGAPDYPR